MILGGKYKWTRTLLVARGRRGGMVDNVSDDDLHLLQHVIVDGVIDLFPPMLIQDPLKIVENVPQGCRHHSKFGS